MEPLARMQGWGSGAAAAGVWWWVAAWLGINGIEKSRDEGLGWRGHRCGARVRAPACGLEQQLQECDGGRR